MSDVAKKTPTILKSPCYKCEAEKCKLSICESRLEYINSKMKKDKVIEILGDENRVDKMTKNDNSSVAIYKK